RVGSIIIILSLLALGLSGTFAMAAPAEQAPPRNPSAAPFQDGVVLVGFHAGVTDAEQAAVEQAEGAGRAGVIGVGTHVLHVPAGQVALKVAAFQQHPQVRYAEPDYLLYADTVPNDPSFGQLWGLQNTGQNVNNTSGTSGADIRAEPAWTVTTGTAGVVVGV